MRKEGAPAVVGDLGADEPLGMLRDGVHPLVCVLWRPHHVVPQLLVYIGIRLCAKLGGALGRRIPVVKEALARVPKQSALELTYQRSSAGRAWQSGHAPDKKDEVAGMGAAYLATDSTIIE